MHRAFLSNGKWADLGQQRGKFIAKGGVGFLILTRKGGWVLYTPKGDYQELTEREAAIWAVRNGVDVPELELVVADLEVDMTVSCKFPHVKVKLIGEDGNVFSIIARVKRALIQAGLEAEAKEYVDLATHSSSYDEVLGLTMNTVEVY